MTETADPAPAAQSRSPLQLASIVALVALAAAAVLGVVAVVDAGSRPAGFGIGLGIAVLIFVSGATIACALACLGRRRMEPVALAANTAACLTIDLLVLAIAFDIESEAYGKVVGTAFVWSFFALVALGLALAVPRAEGVALIPYTAALALAGLAALISTWLVATAGDDEADTTTSFEGTETSIEDSTFGFVPVGDDALLQALGAVLVVLAASWFGALAASRLELRR